MAAKEDLFRLIKSLSRPEKRYFKLNASLYVGEKIYLQLFEMIDNAEEYNEEEIRNQISVAQFAVLKNRLFQLIVKCMAALYTDKYPDAQLREMIFHAQFLRMKGLDAASGRLLERCRSKAMDCGRIEIALEALRMMPHFGITDEEYDINSQSFLLITKLQKQIACKNLFRSVLNFYFEKESIRCEDDLEECAGVLNHPVLKEISSEEDSDLRYYYHVIRASAFILLGNFGNAAYETRVTEEIVKSHKSSAWRRREKTLARIKIMAEINAGAGSSLRIKIENDLHDSYERLFQGIVLLCYNIKTSNLKNHDEVLNGMEEILNPLLLQENRSLPVQKLLLKMTHFAYLSGSFRKALRYGDLLMSISSPSSPLHLQVCQLLILIHAELNNKSLVDSLIKSFVRKISSANRYFASETLLVSCIRRCYLSTREISAKNLREYKTGFEIFRGQFFEKKYLNEIPLDVWLERRLRVLSKQ